MFNCEVYNKEIDGKKLTAVKDSSGTTVLEFGNKKLKINSIFIPKSHLVHDDVIIMTGYVDYGDKSPAIFITDKNFKEYNYRLLNKKGEFNQAVIADCSLWVCGAIDGKAVISKEDSDSLVHYVGEQGFFDSIVFDDKNIKAYGLVDGKKMEAILDLQDRSKLTLTEMNQTQ